MTRVYIAGASSERERCARVIAAVRAAGYTVTHDWPAAIGNGPANELSREDAACAAHDCMRGIMLAGVLVLLVPRDGATSVGCWVELGAALRGPHRIGVVGKAQTIFASDQRIIPIDRDDDVVPWLRVLR